MYRNFCTNRFKLKSRIVMSCPRCVDSVGIRILGSGVVSGVQGKQMTP